jgi:hypothetical protein
MGAIHRVAVRWVTRRRFRRLAINDEIQRARARSEIEAITIGAVHEMARIIESNRRRADRSSAVIEGEAVEIEDP